jgi:hypothetical protein
MQRWVTMHHRAFASSYARLSLRYFLSSDGQVSLL